MTYIKTAVIVLITAALLSLVFLYASLMSIISSTKSNTERVLDSFVIENATFIFDSIKNGHDFTPAIDENYYIYKFLLNFHWIFLMECYIVGMNKVAITLE